MKPQATASIVTKCVLALVITTLMLATSAGAQNTNDIRELLSTLARANGVNLILGDSVKGAVGINLGQIPLDPEETMRLILSANGFAMKKVGDTIIAGRSEELEGLSPISSKVVSLKYASATELIKPLSGIAAGVSVQADPRTNSVIITGTDSDIQMLEQIIMHHPSGIDILPATSGDLNLLEADGQMLRVLAESFASIQARYDYLIVDTGAGVSSTVLTMALGADKVILIVTPEPASISDVYAMIKVIRSKSSELPLILLPNRLKSLEDGLELHKKLNLITQKFLKTNLNYGGSIVEDPAIGQAIIRQRPYVLEYPRSQAAHNLQLVCHRLLKLPPRQIKYRSNIFDRLRVSRKQVESL